MTTFESMLTPAAKLYFSENKVLDTDVARNTLIIAINECNKFC